MTNAFRKVVLFVLLSGMVVVGYKYMIEPATKHLSETKERLQTKLAKLAEFEEATIAADDLTKKLKRLEEAIEFFESRLPPESEIDKVLRDVTLIAQKQGLSSKMIRTLEKKNNSGYIEQPLRMQLVGNFNSFYCFLLELEKLPRIMKIRELELKKQLENEGQIEVDFVVRIFFQNKAS